MSVDNFARTTGGAGSRTVGPESDKEAPLAVPMSATPGTLPEQTPSPHLHRPYYRSFF
jgi:hypothetical protein